MEKSLKNLKPVMLKFMRTRYTEEEVQKRWKKVEKLDEKWIQENGDLGGSANMMSSNLMMCYAVCAFYEAVDRNFTREDFLVLTNEAMEKKFAMLNRFDMNRLEQKGWLMKLAYAYLNRYKKKADQKRGTEWGSTWKMRVNPDHRETGLAFALDTCPLYEFAKKNGYMDVLPYLCAIDHVVAQQFHAKLIRHQMLSDGDEACVCGDNRRS